MLNRRSRLHIYGILAAVLFMFANASLPQSEAQINMQIRDLKVSDIFMPAEIGYILESHPATSVTPRRPIIVHIQEAHTNYEGQLNMLEMLERLIEHYGLKLILVEGGEGDVSLSYLRSYADKAQRQEVADEFLKVGILSAEEYLDITSNYPLILWGVEKKALYNKNLDAFLEAQRVHDAAAGVLSSIQDELERLLVEVAGDELLRLRADEKAFDEGSIKLVNYAQSLDAIAKKHYFSIKQFTNINNFLAVHRLEQEIDFTAVAAEQQVLMKQLQSSLGDELMEQVMVQALEMKAGKLTRGYFYSNLKRLAVASNIKPSVYPQLSEYMSYVTLSDEINPQQLSYELQDFTKDLKRDLASKLGVMDLIESADHMALLNKFVNLALSPKEYAQLQQLDLNQIIDKCRTALSGDLAKDAVSERTISKLSELKSVLPTLHSFYEAVQARDQVLVDNTIAKLEETQESLAVLITGGFHSSSITQLLKERDLGVVVMAPKVTEPTNEELYQAVVRYKSGNGSYDEVMQVANKYGILNTTEADR